MRFLVRGRTAAFLLSLALLAWGPGGSPVSADPTGITGLDTGDGAFISPNILYLGTIPIDAPGIGGRVVKVGKQKRFYVTGVKGLSIYDVTIAAAPVLIGHLNHPHFQNENVAVSDDGKRAVIVDDTARTGMWVIDTSNPTLPTVAGTHTDALHTATCADAKCHWIYGNNGGIYDARRPSRIRRVSSWGSAGHALNRDEAGLLVSDSAARLVLDPRRNPARPRLLAAGFSAIAPDGELDGFVQHNNIRPRARKWKPRSNLGGPMRAGELLIGNSETNYTGGCQSFAGGLSTWDMRGFDRGRPMRQKHIFRPLSGNYADGNAMFNAFGCSSHWFTVSNDIIAAGWFEHGTRFIKVDPKTGRFRQLGYYQPVVTSAWGAYWIDDEHVYTVDAARGIDILRFFKDGLVPTQSQFDESWLAKAGVRHPTAVAERYACRVAASG